jgi:RNA polymerase sigma-70 factor (ECF subfamily)
VAKQLDMTPSTVAVTVHRLRSRYKQLVREAVRPTVADPGELDDEMKHLIATLSA